MILSRVVMVTLMLGLVAGCGNKDKPLSRIKKTGDGPDEFTIIPANRCKRPKAIPPCPLPRPAVRT